MEKVNDKLIGIYFKKCYLGFGKVTEEEQHYLDNNNFVCIVTDNTKNNGYDIESKWIRENLVIGKEYAFVDMKVSQSSSSLRIKEFPNKQFNTVCFEISEKAAKQATIKN